MATTNYVTLLNGNNADTPEGKAEAEKLKGKQDAPAGKAAPAAPATGGSEQPVKVSSPEEARKLPSGTPIILPDGRTGTVP